jgi:hypothetical protein
MRGPEATAKDGGPGPQASGAREGAPGRKREGLTRGRAAGKAGKKGSDPGKGQGSLLFVQPAASGEVVFREKAWLTGLAGDLGVFRINEGKRLTGRDGGGGPRMRATFERRPCGGQPRFRTRQRRTSPAAGAPGPPPPARPNAGASQVRGFCMRERGKTCSCLSL